MRSKLLTIQIIYILVFGLISCSSDKSETLIKADVTPEPSVEKFQVHLTKSDNSFLRITPTMDEVSVKDRFIDHNEHNQGYSSRTHTICKTDYIDGTYSRETKQDGTSVTIRNILPLEVFEPSPSKNPKVECDLEITYIDKETQQDRARVKVTVFITDIQQDSNLDIPYASHNSQFIYNRNEFQGELELPEENLEVKTLCANSSKNTFPTNGKLTYGEAFDDSLFINNNFNVCRFVMSNPKTHSTYVTGQFRVQNIPSSLSVVFHNNLTGETTNDYLNKPLAVIEIKNNTPSTTYFSIERTKPLLTAMPVYTKMFHAGIYDYVGWYNKSFQTHWDLSELEHVSYNKLSNSDTYKVKANQVLKIQITLSGRLNCFSDFHAQPGDVSMNPTFCGSAPFLAGVLYNMQLPTMLSSAYTIGNEIAWKPLDIKPFPTTEIKMLMPKKEFGHRFGSYNFWARNSQVDHTCTGFKAQFSVDQIDRANPWFSRQPNHICTLR